MQDASDAHVVDVEREGGVRRRDAETSNSEGSDVEVHERPTAWRRTALCWGANSEGSDVEVHERPIAWRRTSLCWSANSTTSDATQWDGRAPRRRNGCRLSLAYDAVAQCEAWETHVA